MTNSIIEAISIALNGEFGDGYGIHMEEIGQGLEEPCFFISSLNPTNGVFVGERYFQSNPFCIQYFPEGNEKRRECNSVAGRMRGCLEHVTVGDGSKPIRGTKMKHEVAGGILNFFVNYDCFTYKAEEQIAMGELQSSTTVKEGG